MDYNKPDSPPPYGMVPPPGSPPVISIQPPTIVHFGPDSQSCVCPHCHHQIRSEVNVEANTKTHLFALLLCLIFCPCACLPYCVDSCKSRKHYCPSCHAYLGEYSS